VLQIGSDDSAVLNSSVFDNYVGFVDADDMFDIYVKDDYISMVACVSIDKTTAIVNSVYAGNYSSSTNLSIYHVTKSTITDNSLIVLTSQTSLVPTNVLDYTKVYKFVDFNNNTDLIPTVTSDDEFNALPEDALFADAR
jgi:hypothetical protein